MTIQKLYSHEELVDLSKIKEKELPEKFHELLEFGILASRKDPYDPMESAFLQAGTRYLQNTEHLHTDWILKKEYPLSPELLSITHAWKANQDSETIIGAKGAPEALMIQIESLWFREQVFSLAYPQPRN